MQINEDFVLSHKQGCLKVFFPSATCLFLGPFIHLLKTLLPGGVCYGGSCYSDGFLIYTQCFSELTRRWLKLNICKFSNKEFCRIQNLGLVNFLVIDVFLRRLIFLPTLSQWHNLHRCSIICCNEISRLDGKTFIEPLKWSYILLYRFFLFSLLVAFAETTAKTTLSLRNSQRCIRRLV